MALHSDGKHGWGSASMPATVWKDTVAIVAIATKLAETLEAQGFLAHGEWHVPVERAHHTDGAGVGCLYEPDGSSIDYDASEFAVIATPTGDIAVHGGDKWVWVQFQTVRKELPPFKTRTGKFIEMYSDLPTRKCLKLPRSAF